MTWPRRWTPPAGAGPAPPNRPPGRGGGPAAAMARSPAGIGGAFMGLETWAAFAVASMALLLIPGPTILLVIGQSLGAGRQGSPWRASWRDAWPLVAGVALGDLTGM